MPSTAISRLLKSYTASRLAEMQAQDGEVDTGDKEECQGACTEAEEVTTVSTTVTLGIDRMGMLHHLDNECQHATIAGRHHTSSRTVQNCGTRETNGVEGHSRGNSPVVPATLALSAAGGSGLKVLGETTISLSHPNNPEKKFLHTLLVTADTGYDLVLGQDFLKLKDPVV
uniref:Uncharacterized protein n=1 Tax=Chromera velia CCMP2878 TaxID=1169474 RepID=A0A0K6S9I0_9ALVE|eukprot:Cvel_30066.t2-p1 / transcript=Cvel_30066.t2 / gene=Cvel_30066 / organism=Chromera_velia_CCMP2878 / gene_product=hypothetical protein / transcript_product=hypothetical protein / location=Cvel_scaffold4229:7202-8060(-) / protein_length=170 / sequence_SO=supercontig / SO=protein_coding / is_pseudo=false